MFFGNFISTLFTGLIVLVVSNGATWFITDMKATDRCMNKVAATAYKSVLTRQQLLVRLNARAAKRTGRTLTKAEERADRFLTALDLIRAYPELRNCEVPADVRRALDAINYPQPTS